MSPRIDRAIRATARTIAQIIMTAAVAYLLLWIGMNILLGCETWDSSRWTETNSCIPITEPLFRLPVE